MKKAGNLNQGRSYVITTTYKISSEFITKIYHKNALYSRTALIVDILFLFILDIKGNEK